MGTRQETSLLLSTPVEAACVFSCGILRGSAGDAKGDDDACKMKGEEGGTSGSDESGGMGQHGVTGGVGGDTEHLLEDNL